MIKRFCLFSCAMKALGCLVVLTQFSVAADFVASNRDDVLLITSRIQATQFLTHATFGPTEAEINALAAQMRQIGTVQAASNWIDRQTDPVQTPGVLHQPTMDAMMNVDYPFYTLTLNGNATGSPPNSSNAFGPTRYRQFAWWHNTIAGQDQLRQKRPGPSRRFARSETLSLTQMLTAPPSPVGRSMKLAMSGSPTTTTFSSAMLSTLIVGCWRSYLSSNYG